ITLRRRGAASRARADRWRHATRRSFRQGERCTVKPLLENAEASAIPDQHLAAFATRVHEQEQVARHRIATEPLLHKAKEPVVPLAKIHRLRNCVHATRATRREDHPSALTSATISSTLAPSTRRPFGETNVSERDVGATTTSTRFIAADAPMTFLLHR